MVDGTPVAKDRPSADRMRLWDVRFISRLPLGLLCLGVAVLVSACGSPADHAAERSSSDLRDAIASQDGAAACALLSPSTVDELEQSAGRPCPEAILEETVPTDGTASRVRVFGSMAEVRYDGDTVFLSRFPEGWRVSAAGCTATPRGTYDCVINGG